jgi:Zn-dependent M28 family amino/carboxypeptidase
MVVSRFGAVLASVLSLALPGQVAAQSAVAADPDLADRMHGHVAFLADDALEGREAGTRGFDLAAVYVASQFQSIGLRPAGGDGWRQPVRLIERSLVGSPVVSWTDDRGAPHAWTADEHILIGASVKPGVVALDAPLVFAGYGIEAPEYGVSSYEGIDARGKIVVIMRGGPAAVPSEVAAHLSSSAGQTAQAHGAIGVIQIGSRRDMETYPWAMLAGYLSGPQLSAADQDGRPVTRSPEVIVTGLLGHSAAAVLLSGAPTNLEDLLDAVHEGAALPSFALSGTLSVRSETAFKSTESANIVGLLPGTDPALADEPILVTAHLDHEGISGDESKEDRIYNGAMDNASGVAAMIESARILAGAPPRRPVMFVALTAEEKGLLGAAYMAANPLTPNADIAAVVNLDMPILTYDFQDLVAFGAEHSTLGDLVARAASAEGLTLTPDPTPEEMLFVRSDHYEFVKAGVPAVFLATGPGGPGAAASADFVANHYHQPSDDLSLPIDWNAAAKFARLNAAIIRSIGDAEQRPLWRENSFFGRLFAPDAAKAPALTAE